MSGAPGAADQVRVRAHRAATAGAAVELLEPGERVRHPLERQRERDDAAAVDRRRDRRRGHAGRRRDLGQQRLLHRMLGAGGTPRWSSRSRAQSASMPACLPEQLCFSREGGCPAGPHSSSSSVASARASSARDRRELLVVGEVRRRGDREVVVRRGPRSARASGSAWSGFAAERMKVTSSASPAAATTAPSRSPRPRATRCTDSTVAAAPHGYADRVGHSAENAVRVPELPEMEALAPRARRAACPRSRSRRPGRRTSRR